MSSKYRPEAAIEVAKLFPWSKYEVNMNVCTYADLFMRMFYVCTFAFLY